MTTRPYPSTLEEMSFDEAIERLDALSETDAWSRLSIALRALIESGEIAAFGQRDDDAIELEIESENGGEEDA